MTEDNFTLVIIFVLALLGAFVIGGAIWMENSPTEVDAICRPGGYEVVCFREDKWMGGNMVCMPLAEAGADACLLPIPSAHPAVSSSEGEDHDMVPSGREKASHDMDPDSAQTDAPHDSGH